MNSRASISLLVFDLDGTLIDSREDLAAAVNAVRADYGLGALSVARVSGHVGDGVRKLIERSMRDAPAIDLDEAVGRMRRHYKARMADRTVLYPGVAEGIAALHEAGYRLALVSNKVADACAALLRHFGLQDRFSVVLGGDSTRRLKPDPEPLLLAMARTGALAEDTWMIGDHNTDLEIARRAGAHSAFVTYGIGNRGAERPEQTFDSFRDVTGYFIARRAAGRGLA